MRTICDKEKKIKSSAQDTTRLTAQTQCDGLSLGRNNQAQCNVLISSMVIEKKKLQVCRIICKTSEKKSVNSNNPST